MDEIIEHYKDGDFDHNSKDMRLFQALRYLDSIGYTHVPEDTFTYFNDGNSPRRTKSYYLIEKDTKIGAFNVNARRDDNFKKLQNFRFFVMVRNKFFFHEF